MNGVPFDLDDLVHARAVESNRRELKATWSAPAKEQVVRTICAFANDLLNMNGGYVVIGLEQDENGRPVLPPRGLGDHNLDKMQSELYGLCRQITPEYQPVVFPVEYMDAELLVVWAPGGDNRPYQAPRGHGDKTRVYFIRRGSQTREARDDTLDQLLEQTARIPFDDRRSLTAGVEQLSPLLVRQFLVNVRSDLVAPEAELDDIELYRRLRLTVRVNSHEVPRNVGLLFFSPDPDRHFRGARVEVAQFADDAGGDFIEEHLIKGPLPDQIRRTVDYLGSMGDTLIRKVPEQAEIERTVAYPYEAMEEALVNAIYHRSYDGVTEPAKVYLYPDRMEIISYPGPVHGIESRHLAGEASLPPVPARNRRIGELLKELRLAEARGTGIPKIRRRMRENGSPAPRFDFDEARSYFRVTLPVHPRYLALHALRESAAMWAMGDRSPAISVLQRAFESQPASGAVAAQLIAYRLQLGDERLARSVLSRFESAPGKSETVRPYLHFVTWLLERRRFQEALDLLDRIDARLVPIQESPEQANLRRRAGDLQGAHRILESIYPETKDDPRVVRQYARTKIDLGDSLRKHGTTGNAGSPHDEDAARRLHQEAARLARRAIQLSPDAGQEAWSWFELARALGRIGTPPGEVEAAYARAVELKSDEPAFARALKRFRERHGTPEGS